MSVSFSGLPDDFWAHLSLYLQDNDLLRLVQAGNSHVARRIRRTARALVVKNQRTGYLNLNAIFLRASELPRLESLSVTTRSPAQAPLWPVNLSILPQSLKQLRVTSRHCAEAILCNHALPLLLPNLGLLHLKTEVNLDPKTRELPLWNLPLSVTSLEIFTSPHFVVNVQDLDKLPPTLSHLGLRCMLQATPNFTGNVAKILRRYPLRHLSLESMFAHAPNLPIVIYLAHLPSTLTSINLDVPQIHFDFMAHGMKDYVASQAYQDSYECEVNANELLNSGELDASISEHSKLKFAWKDVFPALSSLHIRTLTFEFDSLQLFPPTMTDFHGCLRGPEPTRQDYEMHRAAHNELFGAPLWLPDNEVARNMKHLSTYDSLNYSPATISYFRSLRSLFLGEASITHTMVGILPKNLEKLHVRDVMHIDALPDGLTELECSTLETPHGSPLLHRGLPSSLKSLYVSQRYIGHSQVVWLPPALTSLTAHFTNADAWLAFTPSHSRWHKLFYETPVYMPRSHPCEKLPSNATSIDFLPKLVYLRDLADRTSLPSCLDLPRNLETLLLGISSSSASHNFWGGMEKLERLSSLRLVCHKERLSSFFKHLPRNLTRLECIDPTWIFTVDDLAALPQKLETLIVNRDLGSSYPPSDNLKRSSLFDPMMAKALPRSLETLKWASEAPRLSDVEISRFVDALPPQLSFIYIEPTVDHFYFGIKPVYGGMTRAKTSLVSRYWKLLLILLSIVTAHMLFQYFDLLNKPPSLMN